MPTSSQALILQFTSGQLPIEPLPPITVSRRQEWRYDPEDIRAWQKPDMSELLETLQTPKPYNTGAKHIQMKPTGTKTKRKPLQVQHYGNKPLLDCKVDFTTLPEALRIRGLHGSFYNPSENSVSWQVNTVGPFYERLKTNMPDMTQRRGIYNTPTGGDRTKETYLYKEFAGQPRFAYTHGNKEQTHDATVTSDSRDTVTKYITSNTIDGDISLTESKTGSAGYFHLVFHEIDSNTGQVMYRLQQCPPGETGSFRMSAIDDKGIGDFQLIPPPGFVADDFRIVKSFNGENCYTVIKADEKQEGKFHYVQTQNEGTVFQLPMEHKHSFQLPPASPRRAWELPYHKSNTLADCHLDNQRKNIDEHVQNGLRTKTPFNSTDRLYKQYGDVQQSDHANDNQDASLPYLNKCAFQMSENKQYGNATGQVYASNETGYQRASPIGRYLTPSPMPRGSEQFGQQSTRNQPIDTSSETYSRLMGLGFRRVRGQNDINDAKSLQSAIEKNANIAKNRVPSSEWKTHDFDQWSRTTDTTDANRLESAFAPADTVTYLKRNSVLGKPGQTATGDNLSLIDEIKLKADYKEWKKKKITAVRMRKELPPKDDMAVCIRLADNVITHDRLLKSIERENDVKLRSLRFDPISVHSSDSDTKSQWILRFDSKGVCDGLIITGLKIDDVTYTVRRFNDVMREEHDAYKFYEIIKEINTRKQQKVKKSKNSETQTFTLNDSRAK